jgi:hypothetical protein
MLPISLQTSINKMSKRRSQELQRSQVRFIAEQDGPIEQALKRTLIEVFHNNKTVTGAYLAAIDYGELTTYSVALCLRALSSPDRALMERIGSVFASLFSSEEHLDILFLSDEQEKNLLMVCRAFYESGIRSSR